MIKEHCAHDFPFVETDPFLPLINSSSSPTLFLLTQSLVCSKRLALKPVVKICFSTRRVYLFSEWVWECVEGTGLEMVSEGTPSL